MFCPKCGGILRPKKVSGKKVMSCSCGYVNKTVVGPTIVEGSNPTTVMEIVDDREEEKNFPLTDEECMKCGHKKAFYFLMQTRSSDEAETKFLKCQKCKHSWRDYS